MKSITIHGIDAQLESLLKTRASNEGLSMNKTIKMILSQSLGLKVESAADRKRDEFAEFFGVWNDEQVSEFQAATEDLEKIDPDEWR